MLVKVVSTDTSSVVTIPESKLNHTGRYILNAESLAGHKVLKVRVNVLGEWVPSSYLQPVTSNCPFQLYFETISKFESCNLYQLKPSS